MGSVHDTSTKCRGYNYKVILRLIGVAHIHAQSTTMYEQRLYMYNSRHLRRGPHILYKPKETRDYKFRPASNWMSSFHINQKQVLFCFVPDTKCTCFCYQVHFTVNIIHFSCFVFNLLILLIFTRMQMIDLQKKKSNTKESLLISFWQSLKSSLYSCTVHHIVLTAMYTYIQFHWWGKWQNMLRLTVKKIKLALKL